MTWSDPSFGAIASIIRDRTGLVFPPSRRDEIERALSRALPLGTDPDQVRSLLDNNDEAKDALIAELTIGESYFLRDSGQFTLLRTLLPRLAEIRDTVPVRVWSAGCATGEEPYSVVILAEQLGLGNRVSVLGTDISRARLAHARRGQYRPWSLRGVPPDVVDRFFEQRGRHFHIRPHVRQRVDFRYLNLAEDRFPSLTAGIWGMDVILCRNVLIYFDRDTVARVARGLAATLTDEGWLILGASDPAIGDIADVHVMLTAAGLVYRRKDAAPIAEPVLVENAPPLQPPPAEPEPWQEPAEPPRQPGWAVPPPEPVQEVRAEEAPPPDDIAELDRIYAARDYAGAEALTRSLIARGVTTPRVWIVLVRSLANRGCLDPAGSATASALEQHRDSAELLYLHAMLLAQSGLFAEAATAARRALYLDRDLVVAHMALSNARARLGDGEGARRALRNAEHLLRGMADDAVVPASDGQIAGRLKQMVRAQLSLLVAA